MMRVGDKRGCPSNREQAPLIYGALFKLRSESAISHHKGNKPRGRHVIRASAHCSTALRTVECKLARVTLEVVGRRRCSISAKSQRASRRLRTHLVTVYCQSFHSESPEMV